MNSRAIQSLRKKFIFISTLTYFLVMLFMGGSINLVNYITTHRQIRLVLSYLIQNEGILPAVTPSGTPRSDSSSENNELEHRPGRHVAEADLFDFSPEFRYSTRYFSFIFDENGEVVSSYLKNIAEITEDEAYDLAREALSSEESSGHYGHLYYARAGLEDGCTIVAVLNCRTQINTNHRILVYTMMIAAAGLLIALILVFLFSSRVIKPEIENVKRQKQFITNASHELKTPLAVIRANTEIEEMVNGSNEWTQSTMRQVDRLSGLVANLVMIARAQEREDRSVMTEIDVSKCVEETVHPYESLAQQEKKTLEIQVPEGIRMIGDESKIRQLTSLLIDNAFKYCDDEGCVKVRLETLRKGKAVRLIVANTFKEGKNVDYSRYFERFYREDESHNADKGGYGIGLSIAESICHQYGGSIAASWKDGEISFTCLLITD